MPSPPQASVPEGPPPRRRFALARRLLAPVLRPVADYLRRYLQASVEHQLRGLTAQTHEARARLDQLERELLHVARLQQASLERLHAALDARFSDLTAQITAAHRDVHDVASLLGSRFDRLDGLAGLFGPRFDELEIKARPLIPYADDAVAVRMGDGYVLAPADQPNFLLMLADATTGGLEPGTRKVLKRLIEPGMHVADVGANIGLLTLVCARSAGPTGRVYSFEPEAGPRSMLSRMTAMNGLRWVDVRDVAVGRAAGRLTFHVSPIIGHSSLYALPQDEEAQANLVEVEVAPLDALLGAKARLDVVKIDVEGAELDVLAGMTKLLKANPDIALIAEYGPSHLARVGLTPKAWFKAFAAKGFTPYAIGEPFGLCAPCDADSLAGVESVNVAFVRPGGAAEQRLLGA